VSIEYMAKYMIEHELDSSPVTTSDGRLIGLLMRQDVERVARALSQKKGLEAPGS
jgi:predicted transcriptional regulator